MKCEEAEARLSWYLDGEAPEVEEHLKVCGRCRAKLESLKEANALLVQAAERFAPAGEPTPEVVVGRVRRRIGRRWGMAVTAATLLVAFVGTWIYMNVRTAEPQEVIVFGAKTWAAGAEGVLRVVVRDGLKQVPVAGALVFAALDTGATCEAVSGPDGSAEIRLPAPEEGDAELTLTIRSRAGTDTLKRKIVVERRARVMITTDKPLYQPAQTIHLRALALDSFSMRPYGGEITLEVEDPNGNRVFKRTEKAGEFGILSADFVLADEVLLGRWRIKATAANATSERTVEVKRYVLPRFKIDLVPDRSFYAPGQRLSANLEAHYTFGKPVADAEVRVELSSWVADRFETFAQVSTRTDAQGRVSIEADLRGKFFGTDLGRGDAMMRLEAVVTDGAAHAERKAVASTVTNRPLRLSVFPEGGEYVRGVAGQMYVVASYPDGRPARVTVEIENRQGALRTDATGVLLAPIPSRSFRVTARDDRGNTVVERVDLREFRAKQDFILRTDRTTYRAGETMALEVLAATDGIVYVDLVREGQTLLTKWVEVRNGRGALEADLPAELFGMVRASAYRIDVYGRVTRDSRLVVVDLPGDLQIRPTLSRETYKPGEEMKVGFEVLDASGRPVVAALGLSVVDEAVFALNEARPGMEKAYFQIEEDLLKPRVQLKAIESLTLPPAAPVRLDVAEKPEIAPIVSAFYSTKAWEVRDAAKDFNVAAVMIVIVLLVLGFVVLSVFQAFRGKFILVEILVVLVIIGLFAALLLPSVAKAIRRSRIALKSDGMAINRGFGGGGLTGETGAPRIREHFPETLYWNPRLITDENGRAAVRFPGADSITTWRMAASAVARDGKLGAAEKGIRVFQPFFIDLDLPVAFTQGDQAWLPVAVFNYLEEPQTVTLSLEAESGFEIVGEREKKIDVRPGDVTSVRFHVRAREFGRHKLLVKAIGTKFSDAVRRAVEVHPDGLEIPVDVSDRLTGTARTTVRIPREAIDGASRLWVRLFPSTFSEIVTGLEGLIRMPYG